MLAEVVTLRDRPLINNVVGQLRQLADRIEKGEQVADYALVIVDGDSAIPDLFGFGNALDTRDLLGMMDIAKDWFIRQLVSEARENGDE